MISASGALNILGAALGPTPINNANNLALLWGATGEQEWTPALTTGWYTLSWCFNTFDGIVLVPLTMSRNQFPSCYLVNLNTHYKRYLLSRFLYC